MLFSFTVLVKLEDEPSVQEGLVILYILSTAMEKTREVRESELDKRVQGTNELNLGRLIMKDQIQFLAGQ